ncbi:MAG: hypothetical protein IKH63_01265 [Prevotella sp.]|nr:hypothetical protein [Prevotella sp.]
MKRIIVIILSFLALTMLASCIDNSTMRERLDYVSQCNRADTVFTEAWLPTVDSLVRYFDNHGNSNEQMKAHYLKGRVYHDMGEAPIALECYQQATEMADTTLKDCDYKTLAAIYGQMANLFHSQFLPSNEMKAQKMTELYYWKIRDTLAAIKAYELRIRPLFLKNEIDSMIIIMHEARKRYLEFGDKAKAAQSIFAMISILLDSNKVDEAKHYLDVYEKESGNFDKKGELIFGGAYYTEKGRYLLSVGDIDSARVYFHKAIRRGQYEGGYKGLLSVYQRQGVPDSIAKYSGLFAAANDSSYLHVNQEKVHQVSAMYNYIRNRELAMLKEREASDLRHSIHVITLSAIALLSFMAYMFYLYRARRMAQLNVLKDRKEALENIVREKELELQLAAKSESNSIKTIQEKQSIINSVNRELGELKLQIATLQEEVERFHRDKSEDNFYSLRFIGEFESRFKEYHNGYTPPTTREWNRLEKVFSIHFPSYYQKIISKDGITKEHIRICMLVRMDFRERMMAVALKTDGKRIDRAKRQANKILFSEDNASTLKSHLKQYF